MKIKELLELSKTKTIEEIAEKYLYIDEKKARKALVVAKCYTIYNHGSRWYQDEDGDQSDLEKSVYEFHAMYTHFEDRKKVEEQEALAGRGIDKVVHLGWVEK